MVSGLRLVNKMDEIFYNTNVLREIADAIKEHHAKLTPEILTISDLDKLGELECIALKKLFESHFKMALGLGLARWDGVKK